MHSELPADLAAELLRPDPPSGAVQVIPLEKGGSGRVYFRVCLSSGESFILAKYTDQREENLHFVDIAQFLKRCGLNVPRIFHHEAEHGLIWMQDLGNEDLWSFRDADWGVRKALYVSALRQAVRLHTHATEIFRSNPHLHLQLEFNENLYLWEQEYFVEHGLRGALGMDDSRAEAVARSKALRELARELASLPRCLIHRDFQSQNILIHEASAWLIDFQGMRFGLPLYDVASLLYDPYVSLSDSKRLELLGIYRAMAVAEGMEFSMDFERVFLSCAAQRLMQALGAYGFLGLKCNRPAFLKHVPAARASLINVLSRLDGLAPFAHLLES
jgi:aminoglycoside/choline kinase family phosphotransferase